MEGVELFTCKTERERMAKIKMLAMLRREGRALKAADFRSDYAYGPDFEGRTCIWPRGVDSWSENSSGIMWIGVHGDNCICVVTKASDVDVKRVHNRLIHHTKEVVLQRFRRSIISELDDLADRSSELSKRRDPTINLPFGVVSVCPVIPATNKAYKVYRESVYKTYADNKMNRYWELMHKDLNIGQNSGDEHENGNEDDKHDQVILNILEHEKTRMEDQSLGLPLPCYDTTTTIMHLQNNTGNASSNGNAAIQASIDGFYDVDAIQYLMQQLKTGDLSTIHETVLVAISAFQRLFNKDFEAAELGVSVMDPNYFVKCQDMYTEDVYVKHLKEGDIEEYLATIKLRENNEIKQGDDLPPSKKRRGEGSSSGGIVIVG